MRPGDRPHFAGLERGQWLDTPPRLKPREVAAIRGWAGAGILSRPRVGGAGDTPRTLMRRYRRDRKRRNRQPYLNDSAVSWMILFKEVRGRKPVNFTKRSTNGLRRRMSSKPGP